MNERPRIVIVTPVFNEEDGLPGYAETVTRVLLDRDDLDCQVILVDDGSRDRSWEIISALSERDPRFRGVRLSRNFGSHVALSAGFANVPTDADAAASLACDLQDPPETILEFVQRWREGYDICWGERLSRQDRGWKVWTSRRFNNLLAKHALPEGSKFTTGSFLLMDRRVLDCFNEFKEHNRITFALVAWTGFDQVRVPYHRVARTAGVSKWSFARMIKTMYDALLGLSSLPVRVMKWAASGAVLAALCLIAYVTIHNIVSSSAAPGWASQLIVFSSFFAVQFGLMAIVGEYLNRIYLESTRRPYYFISHDTAVDSDSPFRQHRPH